MSHRPPKASVATLTRDQVDEFDLVEGQLARFHEEMASLVKGKANDALNTFKLGLLNNLLGRANSLLGTKYEAVAGFRQFDLSQLPSTSDAIVVISQYLGALEKFRADNIVQSVGSVWYWVIEGKESTVRAVPPKRLTAK